MGTQPAYVRFKHRQFSEDGSNGTLRTIVAARYPNPNSLVDLVFRWPALDISF
jgi:hypothetical protein